MKNRAFRILPAIAGVAVVLVACGPKSQSSLSDLPLNVQGEGPQVPAEISTAMLETVSRNYGISRGSVFKGYFFDGQFCNTEEFKDIKVVIRREGVSEAERLNGVIERYGFEGSSLANRRLDNSSQLWGEWKDIGNRHGLVFVGQVLKRANGLTSELIAGEVAAGDGRLTQEEAARLPK